MCGDRSSTGSSSRAPGAPSRSPPVTRREPRYSSRPAVSAAVRAGLSGAKIAPSRAHARKPLSVDSEGSARQATTSPRPTPRARSAYAHELAAASRSAKVHCCLPSVAAVSEGRVRRQASTMEPIVRSFTRRTRASAPPLAAHQAPATGTSAPSRHPAHPPLPLTTRRPLTTHTSGALAKQAIGWQNSKPNGEGASSAGRGHHHRHRRSGNPAHGQDARARRYPRRAARDADVRRRRRDARRAVAGQRRGGRRGPAGAADPAQHQVGRCNAPQAQRLRARPARARRAGAGELLGGRPGGDPRCGGHRDPRAGDRARRRRAERGRVRHAGRLRDAAADRRRRRARRCHARAGAAVPGAARGGEPACARGWGRNGAGGMTAATARQLLDGCAAITESAIAAGCRFFAGYPISPFTGLLENMSRRLPEAGGHCLNAESEIEAVNMALGASAAGARAATGSCGQGLALMQEAIAELAPKDVPEAVEHTQLLFHLADRYRAPVMLYGDPLIAQTYVSVDVAARDFGPLPAKDWALDGTTGGTGRSRQIWTWAMGKATEPGPGPDGHWRAVAAKFDDIAATEARSETYRAEDAETLVVAFGSAALFVEHVVDELRADGHRVGLFRPVTLWPFPADDLAAATRSASRVLVFELNAGQMLDDVRQFTHDRGAVRFIGGVSIHASGLSFGPLLDVAPIRERILEAAA